MTCFDFVITPVAFVIAAAEQPADAAPGWVMFLPLVVMVVFWYLLIIRPQQSERAKRQDMLNALKKNDRVVTSSGMLGTVANISQDGKEVTLKFGESTRIPFLRSAIEAVITNESTTSDTTSKP